MRDAVKAAGTMLVVMCLILLAAPASRAMRQTQHRWFASPEEAVKELVNVVRKGSLDDLLALFGPEGKELIASSDPGTARRNREVFKVAAAEKWQLVDETPNRKTLVIGNEDWPFPVPLVKEAAGWRFDTAAGREEVIARRIGRNELAAIDSCRAYVTAQQRYAQQGHDGVAAGAYAQKFRSDQGKENGLYWPTAKGQKRSPLGDLVAEAAADGVKSVAGAERSPLHGYYFKIVTEQGRSARGGARNYIVNGVMSRGFALVAWPATYDVTGVMTFVVNQDGTIYEKDLGPTTNALVQKMTAYNPDSSWRAVK